VLTCCLTTLQTQIPTGQTHRKISSAGADGAYETRLCGAVKKSVPFITTESYIGVASENGIYGHSRFCNTDFDDKLACLNLSGV
jgi:hypothetical protein